MTIGVSAVAACAWTAASEVSCWLVPLMPHSAGDLGLFDPRERNRTDTLNRFEHWWATPVQFVLLLFGFANAGVTFEQIGPGTYYVLAGLLLGKPLGILLFTSAARLAGACLPSGLRLGDLLVVGEPRDRHHDSSTLVDPTRSF